MNTTADKVKQILDTDLTSTEIEAYIKGAYEFLNAAFSDVTVGEDLRAEIERWVSAHMIASTREQQLSEAGAGSAKAKFQGKTGMNLDATFYGQTAQVMDITGTLAALGGKGIEIIGL